MPVSFSMFHLLRRNAGRADQGLRHRKAFVAN
jgi:hypothetical protein